MLEKLWKDINLIYEGLNFSKDSIQENLVIISQDNYYILLLNINIPIKIKIEKDYNLVKMWSSDVSCDMVNYKIHVEVGDQVYTSENSMIELTYNIIRPFLREVKLNKLIK